MNGLEQFRSSLAEVMAPLALRLLDEHRDDMGQVIENELFDLPGPRSLDHPQTAKTSFEARVFRGFIEISDSFEHLQNLAIYVRRFPYGKLGVSRNAYLRFIIESYFHELYILRERLLAYLRAINRAFRQEHDHERIASGIEHLRRAVKLAFALASRVRGSHVHKFRFEDAALRRLAMLDLLGTENSEFRVLLDIGHRKIRKDRREWMERNNANVEQVLGVYFDALHKLLFPKEGSLRYPRRAS